MFLRSAVQLALGLTLAATVGTAVADPTIITGVDPAPGGQVLPDRAPALQRNTFLASLSSYRVETFDLYTPTPTPIVSLALTGIGTLQQAELDPEDPDRPRGLLEDDPSEGRFNTTPVVEPPIGAPTWWETPITFTMLLSETISAFGFFCTDIGDFDGVLTLQLLNTATGASVVERIPSSGSSGSLLFYGISDDELRFDQVTFGIDQPGSEDTWDYIGFDDLVFGNVRLIPDPPGVPEPGSLLLAGAALVAAGAARRTQRRA